MLRFNDIADRMLEYHPSCELSLLQRAYVFSAKVHDGQERLSGEPYLIHPLEVAGILVDLRMDEVTVAAGLLHDTIEDTLTTIDEIKRLFGEPVAFLVGGLTKIAKIEFTSARERQAENFRKMLLAMSKDIRILLIKLPTACTTCARSSTWPRTRGGASPRRRSRSTPPSRTAWAFIG
jgi:GTP pyrophosphokinase